MKTKNERPVGQIGRPRDPDLERSVLRAAVDVVIERGYTGATVDAVARAAGTGKAAVYRRWPSKSALMIAAVQSLQVDAVVPDTGTLRGDLYACARHYTRSDRRSAHVLAGLLGEVKSDPQLRQAAFNAIGKPPAEAFAAVLDRWICQGVISSSAPADLIAAIMPALAFREVIVRSRSLDIATVTRLVDDVFLPALGMPTDAAAGRP